MISWLAVTPWLLACSSGTDPETRVTVTALIPDSIIPEVPDEWRWLDYEIKTTSAERDFKPLAMQPQDNGDWLFKASLICDGTNIRPGYVLSLYGAVPSPFSFSPGPRISRREYDLSRLACIADVQILDGPWNRR
jgi:hypothetical protein